MTDAEPRVTIHMAASLDGFIAREDGSADWLETSDEFEDGETLDPEYVEGFVAAIDCYVMGSRTYETALGFEAKGFGWSYGDKPTFVLTSRELPKTRDTVEFYSGNLAALVNERLKPSFRNIWFVGGGSVSGECLRGCASARKSGRRLWFHSRAGRTLDDRRLDENRKGP
jgi:dihydrofolate reductase